MEVMYVKNNLNSYFINKNLIGFSGEINDLKILTNNLEHFDLNKKKKVKTYLGKTNEYLKPLGLGENLLNMKLENLGSTNYKLIMLIKTISIKPQMIILNNIEIGMNDRIANRLIRFIKSINSYYNIKIMVSSKNSIFLSKFVKDVLVMKKGIIKYQGSLMLAVKQNFLDKPAILKFVEMANLKGAALKDTFEEKELLKEIYRSVS